MVHSLLAFFQIRCVKKAAQDPQATCIALGAESILQSFWLSVHVTLIVQVLFCCRIELSAFCFTTSGPLSTVQECLTAIIIGMLKQQARAGLDTNAPALIYGCDGLGLKQSGLRALKSCSSWVERSSGMCDVAGLALCGMCL